MSVQFFLFDPAAESFLGDSLDDPTFHSAGAGMVADALNLHELSHDGQVWAGGSCPVDTFRERLLRWPDGHPDPEVQQRLAQLAKLVTGAPADMPGVIVSWG